MSMPIVAIVTRAVRGLHLQVDRGRQRFAPLTGRLERPPVNGYHQRQEPNGRDDRNPEEPELDVDVVDQNAEGQQEDADPRQERVVRRIREVDVSFFGLRLRDSHADAGLLWELI